MISIIVLASLLILLFAYHIKATSKLKLDNHQLLRKSEHLSMASHEVKNLALEISSLADDIKKGFSSPPLVEAPLSENETITLIASDVKNMYMAAKTLGNFVFEFLEVNRMQNVDSIPVIFSKLNVSNALKDVIRIYKHQVSSKHIHLRVSKRITASELYVTSDTIRVKQILLNLVGNAVKYTDFGGVEIDAYVDSEGYLDIIIKDTGIGIPKKQIKKVLTGTRASNALNRDGNGVGLLAVNRIVQSLGGVLTVESEEGVGTTIKVRIKDETNVSI